MSVIVLLGCAVFSVSESVEVLFEDGFEERPDQLDCEKFSYPCSLAEADPDALTRAVALLEELWDIRKAGTLDDCHAHLSNQPDVVLIFRGETSLSFQVEGMMPVVFDEIPDIPEAPLARINISPESITPGAGKTLRVVGEDSNGNGIIDQRDKKKAWLLSPFEWLSPVSETDDIAAVLEGIPAYQDSVNVQSNLSGTDNNVTIDVWKNLGFPDVLVISTFSGSGTVTQGGIDRAFHWISSGIPVTNPSDNSLVGVSLVMHFSDSGVLDPITGRRAVFGLDFFKNLGVDSSPREKMQLMIFSREPPRTLFWGSFEHVSRFQVGTVWLINGSEGEFRIPFLRELFNFLAEGLTLMQAGRSAVDSPHTSGINVEYFSNSDSDDARIIELPRLMFNGTEAPFGFPLFNQVVGTVGDETNDKLKLTVQVDGVLDDNKDDFQIRYRIAQQDVPGSFGLEDAMLIDDYGYLYEVEHELDLGFPLQSGVVPIEIIVDLPEGGESRYTGLGSLAACHFYAQFSGEVSGAFAGPAGYNFNHDGTMGFFFKSTEFIWALDPFEYPVWQSDLNFAETSLPEEGASIQATSADLTLGLHNYIYFPPGGEDWTCDTCGGKIHIGKVVADVSVAGSTTGPTNEGWIRLTRPPDPSDPPGYKATVDLQMVFVAAEGRLIDGGTPFNECALEYDP
jgi:hypothetical protein